VRLEAIKFADPVISLAIAPRAQKDRDKLAQALAKLALEDPTFRRKTDEETGETIISGMGELHLEIVLSRLAREHRVDVVPSAPKVAYRQTIAAAVEVEGRHVKQTGGHGQYGIVLVRFEPDPLGQPLVFVNEVVGGNVPREFVPSIERGIREALERGGEARFPFVNVRATLVDGKYHAVDSSDLAFHLAGRAAFQACLERTKVLLLEPRMKFEVVVPEEHTGDALSDLKSRRAEIAAIDQVGHLKALRGIVPIAEMFQYTTSLRSMTQGRGTHVMEPEDYGRVPDSIALAVYEEARKRRRATSRE
jgi:elongation factor G